MKQLSFFAKCVCYNCMARWNQEYVHQEEISCPECEKDGYVTFEDVEVLE
jgi:hypothetical protein